MTTVQSVNFIHRYYGHFSFDQEKYMQYNDLILLVQGHIIMLQHQTATIRLHMVTVPSGCYLIFHEKKKKKTQEILATYFYRYNKSFRRIKSIIFSYQSIR